MKKIFDEVSYSCSEKVTKTYSTSFSLATRLLSENIRRDIYNIYGFVRFADEIVDSFHDYDKKELFKDFSFDLKKALKNKIHLNPILNSFQHTFHKYDIDISLVNAFMKSMEMDLSKKKYSTVKEFKEYIYGSADVVGLMCLKVFVQGNQKLYLSLKENAMSLGSAFQKVNFLRDLKADKEDLNRSYFPNTSFKNLEEKEKNLIISDIENDFSKGLEGIKNLPIEAKFGVFMAYRYYNQLLKKLKKTPATEIINRRIRVPNLKNKNVLIRRALCTCFNFLILSLFTTIHTFTTCNFECPFSELFLLWFSISLNSVSISSSFLHHYFLHLFQISLRTLEPANSHCYEPFLFHSTTTFLFLSFVFLRHDMLCFCASNI